MEEKVWEGRVTCLKISEVLPSEMKDLFAPNNQDNRWRLEKKKILAKFKQEHSDSQSYTRRLLLKKNEPLLLEVFKQRLKDTGGMANKGIHPSVGPNRLQQWWL